MDNFKIIINAIAIPLSSIATILIISKNRRNIANILIGITAFLGGVLATTFGLLKEIYYPINEELAIIFAKLVYLSIISMTIPTLSFSIFFWRAKYPKIPRFLHAFVAIPAISLTIWLFLDSNVVELAQTDLGVNNIVKYNFSFTTGAVMFLIFMLFLVELLIMTHRARSIPALRRRMMIIAIGFGAGLVLAFISIFVFQQIYTNLTQPTATFVIFTSVCVLLALSRSISRSETLIWHGCPKLHLENHTSATCMNSEEGASSVNLIDIGAIIERIQIDTKIMKTGPQNCANAVFADEKSVVRCLTTHLPIKILDQQVSRKEMELAREMDIMNGKELCSECVHKIIAYRKEHKDKSDIEIKTFFLGIRAEEFFGVS
jgi:hypothetical protein